MTRALVFLLAVFWWLPARADYPATYAWVFGSQGSNPKWFDTDPPTACQKYATGFFGTGWICKNVTKNGSAWQGLIYSPSGSYNSDAQSVWRLVCPYGGTLSGSTCVGADPPPPMCQAGKPVTLTWAVPPTNATNSQWSPIDGPATDGQCEVDITEVVRCYTVPPATQLYCTYNGNLTGNNLPASASAPAPSSGPSGSTQTPSNMPPVRDSSDGGKCPLGTVQGGFDQSGIPICMGTGSAPQNPQTPPPVTTKPPVTVNNSDGSTTTTQQTVQQNSDGSTTTITTTTVVAADGSKTVTVGSATTNNSAGTSGRQDTPSADQMNLCKQNPNLTICQNSTVTGTCGQISCTGDAIQCATLRAAAAIQCQQKQTEDDLKASSAYTLGSAVMSGADPAASTLPSPSKATTVTMPGTLDQSGWLGAGQCFADKVVSVQGRTFVLPYSKACDYLIVLRLGLMVIASLVSFRIVRDAVLT